MAPYLRYASPAGRWVLLATVLGSSLASVDATVVNLALPRIANDLGAGLSDLQWIVNAYTLTLAAFLLLGGSLGDRFGRRRTFVIGVVWFTAASVLCALAQTAALLIVARALQDAARPCSCPGASPSSRRPSIPMTGPRRSDRGPGWAGLPSPSDPSSAAGWSKPPRGA